MKRISEGQAVIIALQSVILAAVFCTFYIGQNTKVVDASSYYVLEPIYINPVPEETSQTDVVPEIYEEPVPEFSQEDIDLMARVVMSEASILDREAKRAVAETIINRVHMDGFPNTVADVVYQPHQYSTADNGEPNSDCYEAVLLAVDERIHPESMVFFRTDYPHTFGTYYKTFGNTYFSLKE